MTTLVMLEDRGPLVYHADVHVLKIGTSTIIYTRTARSPGTETGSAARVSEASQGDAQSSNSTSTTLTARWEGSPGGGFRSFQASHSINDLIVQVRGSAMGDLAGGRHSPWN